MARKVGDEGFDETEELLEQLEKRIAKVFKAANDTVTDKLTKYLEQFEAGKKEQQALLDAGKITAQEFQEWQFRHVMMGDRYSTMLLTLSDDYYNAEKLAKKLVADAKIDAYALNYNYATYKIMHDGDLAYSFTLYNHKAVEKLLRENPKLLPDPGKRTAAAIERGEAIRYDQQQIASSITQSILTGEDIVDAAHRLETFTEKDFNAALRNARTAITSAQEAGRQDSYKHAEDIGVRLKRKWVATLDQKTRHEHRELHGQVVAVDEPFEVDGEEIMYPGDPACADPGLIYNCRCRTVSVVEGFEGNTVKYSPGMGEMSYDEWKAGGTSRGKKAKNE